MRRGWRWPLAVARLLALVIALQLGGVTHLGVEFVAGADNCAEPCDDDEGGEKCPPICPDCTCTHGVRPAVPPLVRTVAVQPRTVDGVVLPHRTAGPPDDPDLRGIFQPPRA